MLIVCALLLSLVAAGPARALRPSSANPPGGVVGYPYEPTPAQKASDEEVAYWIRTAQKRLDRDDLPGARRAAEEALRRAVRQRPKSAMLAGVADELAPVYLQSGQYGRAAALFRAYPVREVSLNAALAFDGDGQIGKARGQYRERQLLARHPDFRPYLPRPSSASRFEATLFLWRGIVDVDENHPRRAIWALRRAVGLLPQNPLALWYYAEALASAGRRAEARRFFQGALARDRGLVASRVRVSLTRLNVAGQ